MRRVGWIAGAALGALLVTGCGSDGAGGSGGGATSSASASAQAKPSNGSATPPGSAGQAGSATPPGSAGQAGSAAPAGAFGKEQAAADLAAATAAGGLPQPGSATGSPTPTPTGPVTDADRRRAEMSGCIAPWQTMERVADPEKAYTATIAELERRGWKAAGERMRQDMLSQVTLKKQGWILFARRYDFSAGKGSGMGMPDMLSFFASDLACEGRFTEAEMEEALEDGPQE